MLNDINRTFSEAQPMLDISRSTFSLNQTHKTTLSEGDLVPVYFKEVVPGDSFSIDTAMLVRMATPIFPTMDNAFMDLYFFYVPNRIVWNHWKEFLGENTSAPWTQTVEYNVPQIIFHRQWSRSDIGTTGATGYGPLKGSVMNYLGIPTSIIPTEFLALNGTKEAPTVYVSDLPNRAYRMIWNEFFRDENLQTPVPMYFDDSNRHYYDHIATFTGQSHTGEFYDYGGRPLKVCKFHDYFTSCLPQPQKGSPVSLVLSSDTYLPVVTGEYNTTMDKTGGKGMVLDVSSFDSGTGTYSDFAKPDSSYSLYAQKTSGDFVGTVTSPTSYSNYFRPANLYADASNLFFTNVSTLREAFQLQRLFEAEARSGTRYREILKGIFGVTSPDSRVQVPEYLGGSRIPINMDQVLQTSATDNTSPQGNTAGYSLTTHVDNSFTKSFVEHGMVIGLACIRVEHTYCQNCEPFWFRKRRFHFYYPQFANLSEQPVYKRNICLTGTPADDEVFGYQEAWADYRFAENRLSGEFSPDVFVDNKGSGNYEVVYRNSPLADAWTYNDFYQLDFDQDIRVPDLDTVPSLSDSFIREGTTNIGQTLAVQNEPQFIADFRFNVKATRPMPVHSIPGLIDHH